MSPFRLLLLVFLSAGLLAWSGSGLSPVKGPASLSLTGLSPMSQGDRLPYAQAPGPLGGWVSPDEGAVGTGVMRLAAMVRPSEGGAPVERVRFVAWYRGVDPKAWLIVCDQSLPTPEGVYECLWDLAEAPAGAVLLGLNVYDQAGTVAGSPDGIRQFFHRPPGFLYVASGDSIPGGSDLPPQGAQPYPVLLLEQLQAAGLPAVLATTANPGDTLQMYVATQLEEAVRLDPDLVTITIGANDWLLPYGAFFLRQLDPRAPPLAPPPPAPILAQMREGLRVTLGRVAQTRALVVLTTYYNPVSAPPALNIPDPRYQAARRLFEAFESLSAMANAEIAGVAREYPGGL